MTRLIMVLIVIAGLFELIAGVLIIVFGGDKVALTWARTAVPSPYTAYFLSLICLFSIGILCTAFRWLRSEKDEAHHLITIYGLFAVVAGWLMFKGMANTVYAWPLLLGIGLPGMLLAAFSLLAYHSPNTLSELRLPKGRPSTRSRRSSAPPRRDRDSRPRNDRQRSDSRSHRGGRRPERSGSDRGGRGGSGSGRSDQGRSSSRRDERPERSRGGRTRTTSRDDRDGRSNRQPVVADSGSAAPANARSEGRGGRRPRRRISAEPDTAASVRRAQSEKVETAPRTRRSPDDEATSAPRGRRRRVSGGRPERSTERRVEKESAPRTNESVSAPEENASGGGRRRVRRIGVAGGQKQQPEKDNQFMISLDANEGGAGAAAKDGSSKPRGDASSQSTRRSDSSEGSSNRTRKRAVIRRPRPEKTQEKVEAKPAPKPVVKSRPRPRPAPAPAAKPAPKPAPVSPPPTKKPAAETSEKSEFQPRSRRTKRPGRR
jgi:hypothetical protein